MKSNKTIRLLVLTAAVGLSLSIPSLAASPKMQEDSSVKKQTLVTCQELYWRWWAGELTIPLDANNNAVEGNVVLMALPNAPGDGTPGEIDVTLKTGQSFMLPLWSFLGNRYAKGNESFPKDPPISPSVFKTLELTLTIDDVTIIDKSNVMDYYTYFRFTPEIPASAYPPFIWYQGVGIFHGPLSPGRHTIKLDATNPEPIYGIYTSTYHNTWNITVRN